MNSHYTKKEITKRSKLIRSKIPAGCLESLYEMQNRVCDLCEYPIQDLCFAELDHSIPTTYFARQATPIEEAIRLANHPNNLRAAHYTCNSRKKNLTREEWYARGLNNQESPRKATEEEIVVFKRRLGSGGRIGGHIQGLRNITTGHMERMRSLPQTKEAQKRNGEKSRDSGRLEIMRNLPQTKAALAKLAKSRKGTDHHKEFMTKLGHEYGVIQGRKNRDSGHMSAVGKKWGKINIQKATLWGRHTRWHLNRKKYNPNCSLCASSGKAA